MKKIIIGLVFLFCYGASCDNYGIYRIWVENKTNKGITFLVSKYYPDVTIPDEESNLRGVQPNERTPYDIHEKISEFFESLPADTLSIFIFSNDAFAAYTWQEIRAGYKILRRYDLSRQDIENMGRTITYP